VRAGTGHRDVLQGHAAPLIAQHVEQSRIRAPLARSRTRAPLELSNAYASISSPRIVWQVLAAK
jgi:hypothetical protein